MYIYIYKIQNVSTTLSVPVTTHTARSRYRCTSDIHFTCPNPPHTVNNKTAHFVPQPLVELPFYNPRPGSPVAI